MADRELVRPPFPYKFTLDGSTQLKGVAAEYTHENFNGMDFLNFEHLGLSDTSDDYVWMGLNYETALLGSPNTAVYLSSGGLDDLTSGGTYTGTTNQDVVITAFDLAATPEKYRVSLDNGATQYGTNEPMYCSSTNAGDTTQTITVRGLDENLASQTATQVLNGQTKTVVDAIGTEWRQIHSIEVDVVTAGTVSLYSDDTVTGGVPDNFLVTLRLGFNAGDLRVAVTVATGGIDMSASPVAVLGANGLTVTFAATTGHSTGDEWLISTLGTPHYGEDILESWEVA